jgi:hypothetical protein
VVVDVQDTIAVVAELAALTQDVASARSDAAAGWAAADALQVAAVVHARDDSVRFAEIATAAARADTAVQHAAEGCEDGPQQDQAEVVGPTGAGHRDDHEGGHADRHRLWRGEGVRDVVRRHEAVTLALQIPHELPAQPFDRSRLALWLCRSHTYGVWNDGHRQSCRTCGGDRAAP